VPAKWKGFPFLGASAHIIGTAIGQPPNVFNWNGTDSTEIFIPYNWESHPFFTDMRVMRFKLF
jgi:hypothetical protein